MQTVESEQCSACTQAMHTAPAEKQSICSGLADRLFLLFSVFAIGASFGWVLEVCYRSLVAGHFVNPGFLHGPYLPIYRDRACFDLYPELVAGEKAGA